MKKTTIIAAIVTALVTLVCFGCADRDDGRWSKHKAGEWYVEQGWISGCDFIPSYAVNQLEMWQAETFDPDVIERELDWAERLGFNCMRVFLHHVLWETDRDGLVERMNKYLSIASGHGISTIFVFLDDCWNESYAPGPQPEPKKGVHNSGWVKDPGILYFGPCGSGCDYAADTTAIVKVLEDYVTDVMTTFREDERILMWDLYNEPGGGQDPDRYGYRSFPLLKDIFSWARKVDPSQPLTAGIWSNKLGDMNLWQIDHSDIVTYHTYAPLDSHQELVDTLKAYGRPMICTEYMARTEGSTFQTILPMLRRENIGAINWGLVAGKSNTIFPWSTMNDPCPTEEPEVWFHDILRKNGSPYDDDEVMCILKCNTR